VQVIGLIWPDVMEALGAKAKLTALIPLEFNQLMQIQIRQCEINEYDL